MWHAGKSARATRASFGPSFPIAIPTPARIESSIQPRLFCEDYCIRVSLCIPARLIRPPTGTSI